MKCLIEFLQDNKQEEIRNRCQLQSDTYEETLENYRDAFLAEIKIIKSWPCNNKRIANKSCKENNNGKKELLLHCETECSEYKKSEYIERIYDVIKKIDNKEIESFFNGIIRVYTAWINGDGSESLKELSTILEGEKLLEFKQDISNTILFRGRTSENILSPWDMFHIPFNKRYLILNQRYSLTGQPLLYLGMSVFDVMNELNVTEDDIEKVNISTFDFKEEFEVYDLTNPFYKYLNENKMQISEMIDNQIEDHTIKSEFFKFILSSICKFKRRVVNPNHAFYEEYVIPQLLAQIVKSKGLKGILYSSTNIKDNIIIYNNTYKNNLAIFTNFKSDNKEKHVYDKTLYDKISISKPFNFKDIKNKEIKMEDVEYICSMLELLSQEEGSKYFKYTSLGYKLKDDFETLKVIEKDGNDINKSKEVSYFHSKIGKFQLYLIYSLVVQRRDECFAGGEK